MMDVKITLTKIECGECGGVYAISESHRKHCYEHSKSWTCPYCRTGWGYEAGNGEVEDLQKMLDAANERAVAAERTASAASDLADHLERSRNGMKGALTRIKNHLKKND